MYICVCVCLCVSVHMCVYMFWNLAVIRMYFYKNKLVTSQLKNCECVHVLAYFQYMQMFKR